MQCQTEYQPAGGGGDTGVRAGVGLLDDTGDTGEKMRGVHDPVGLQTGCEIPSLAELSVLVTRGLSLGKATGVSLGFGLGTFSCSLAILWLARILFFRGWQDGLVEVVCFKALFLGLRSARGVLLMVSIAGVVWQWAVASSPEAFRMRKVLGISWFGWWTCDESTWRISGRVHFLSGKLPRWSQQL